MAQNVQLAPPVIAERNDSDLLPGGGIDHIQERNEILKDIPYEVVRKAWFTLSHLLLDDGAHVVDMGCEDGQMAFAMAALRPGLKFTAVDKSKRLISKAKETYKRHNLEYVSGDVSSEMFEAGSVDAIINSFILHQVYSGSRYNERIVSDTLRRQFRMLKVGGTMMIRDFVRPPPEEFVVMEMPDKQSSGPDLKSLSEADLLVWYSEHARPKQDPGCGGFFLEELPARFPRTRLFRLPYKWAYEFIMRKDDRSAWETELPQEYTFFTEREFRKELRGLGARVAYSAPQWDEDYIERKFEGKFRLYDDKGTTLGHPPTSYIVIAQKMSERKSLHIEERRPSTTSERSLRVYAMRNERNGKLVDIATRGLEIAEILPYHVNEDGKIIVYLQDGVARGVANAVPRSGINLDGKRWSGHMVEPISYDMAAIREMGAFDVKKTVQFGRDYLAMKPRDNALLETGMNYYPAPDYIDERVHTYYLHVEQPTREILPKNFIGYSTRFQARGKMRALEAQHVLDAIAVGLLPNARLEMQILSLFQHVGKSSENWISKDLAVQAGHITERVNLKELLALLSKNDYCFRDVKGTKGDLRTVHSIFVEEGQSQGSTTGLSAQDIDFVITEGSTVNTAVVLPLSDNLKGEIHAGFLMEHLPVPQRYEGNGLSVSVPTYNIPPEVTNLKMAKKFIADKFGVPPEMVFRLGESYFSHIGMTPQRIYPFAVAAPPHQMKEMKTQFIPLYQFSLLWRSLSRQPHFMLAIARAYRMLHGSTRLEYKREARKIVQQRFAAAQPDFSLPMSYVNGPSATKQELKHEKEVAKEQLNAPLHPKPIAEPEKPAPEDGMNEFEQDMEEAIDAVQEYAKEYEPKPEKW